MPEAFLKIDVSEVQTTLQEMHNVQNNMASDVAMVRKGFERLETFEPFLIRAEKAIAELGDKTKEIERQNDALVKVQSKIKEMEGMILKWNKAIDNHIQSCPKCFKRNELILKHAGVRRR